MTGLFAAMPYIPQKIDGRNIGRHITTRTPKGWVLHQLVIGGRVRIESSDPADIILWAQNLGVRTR